ncbi:MAG: DUF1292 domain-containing protein [Oscillospiraceae bacterium]|nr:DUF1292 domain-containing protein [Oscillospiraceae bacterium]
MADLNNLPKNESEEAPEDYEDLIVRIDDQDYEIVDELELDGETYIALVPYIENLDEIDEVEFIIAHEIEEEDGYTLEPVEDEALQEKLGDLFIERLEGNLGDDDDDEEEKAK